LSTIQPGIYPITLKITYSDDLKISHVLLVNSSVDFEPKHAQSSNGAGGSGGGLSGIAIASSGVVIIVAAVIVFLFVRRRRSKSKRTKLQSSKDVDPFLDDVSPAPAEKDLSRDLKKR
jgi:flagellar biosynthesis/type III secretory pathway M-ring protein FliF/YscJ